MVRLSANSIRVVDDPDNVGGDATPADNLRTPDHVGAWLREAREATGRDLRDIAAHLRIRYPYLLAIEEGRFDDLPGRAYAVGFIRSYAAHVGLDGEKMAERFKTDADAITADQNLRFPTAAPEGRFPGGSVLLLSAALAAALVGGWYYYQSQGSVGLDRVPPPPPSAKVELPAGDTPPATVRLTPPPAPALAEAPAEAGSATPSVTAGVSAPEPAGAPNSGSESVPDASSDSAGAAAATAAASGEAAERRVAEARATIETQPEASAAAGSLVEVIPPEETTETPPTETSPVAVSGSEAASAPVEQPDAATPSGASVTREPAAPAVPTANQPAEAATMAAAEPAVPPAPVNTPVTEAPAAPAPASETQAAVTPTATPETATPPVAETPPARAAALPSVPAVKTPAAPQGRVYGLSNRDARIVLTARGDSWVQVRDADQNALLTRMLHAGDSYHVPNQAGLVLSAGNPSVLDVSIEGKPGFQLSGENVPMSDIALDVGKLRDGTATR